MSKPLDGSEAAGPPEGFDAAHRALLRDPAIQFEMQVPEPKARVPRETVEGASFDPGPWLQVLFWAALAIGVMLLLYLIVSRLSGGRGGGRASGKAAAEELWRPEERTARTLLGEADALAEQGRYSEAAHLLLHRSIEEIDERRPKAIRPALTSRDIARLPDVPSGPAEAFGRIVRAVESSLFARRALGLAEWRDCRAAYEHFAFPEGWRG